MNNDPRFFLDHGMIHDRVTGKHVHGDATIEPEAAEASVAMLNDLASRVAHLATLPDWMRDRAKVEELRQHLEAAGWRPDATGNPECFDQGAAMAADVIRLVLLPMLPPT